MARHTTGSTVLCGANSYMQKFYLNPAFQKPSESIKRELQILCAGVMKETGDALMLEFDEAGNLLSKVSTEDGDYLSDDIASGMKIGRARFDHQKLLEGLELYYHVVFLGEKT